MTKAQEEERQRLVSGIVWAIIELEGMTEEWKAHCRRHGKSTTWEKRSREQIAEDLRTLVGLRSGPEVVR
jgi:hypothetical protein